MSNKKTEKNEESFEIGFAYRRFFVSPSPLFFFSGKAYHPSPSRATSMDNQEVCHERDLSDIYASVEG